MSPEQATGVARRFPVGPVLLRVDPVRDGDGQARVSRRRPESTRSARSSTKSPSLSRRSTRRSRPLCAGSSSGASPRSRTTDTARRETWLEDLATLRDHLSDATVMDWASAASQPSRRRKRLHTLFSLGESSSPFPACICWASAREGKDTSTPSYRRLTFGRGELGNACFSPDGQTVVSAPNGRDESRQLYATRLDSPESRPLGLGPAEIVAISSAGEMAIVLAVGRKLAVPLSGGVPREILEGVEWVNADWSPDGKNLVVVRSAGGRSRLEFPIGRVLCQAPRWLNWPRFSPNGKQIAFVENDRLAVIESSGKGEETSPVFGRIGNGLRAQLDGKRQ